MSQAQKEYWNAAAGPVWVEFQADLDRQVGPLGEAALRALAPVAGERILDLGCGCGETTLTLAAAVGATGAATGVDLSEPMLAVARARPIPAGAAKPDFRAIDVESDELGEGVFDAAYSRFGVMFYEDPPKAFARVRRALKPGGRLAFVCWRPMAENPLLLAPMTAAASVLGPFPPPEPNAPGPFAFADPARVRTILDAAGWQDVAIQPFDAKVGGASPERALELALRIGPVGTYLREHPDDLGKVVGPVSRALAAYATPKGVLFPAAVWIVTARAG